MLGPGWRAVGEEYKGSLRPYRGAYRGLPEFLFTLR